MSIKGKRKISYIITQSSWGGAQRYVFDLANSLMDEMDVTVASGNKGELTDKLGDIKTHQFKYLVRPINPFADILAILEIAIFYNKQKPDVVHLNSSKAGILGSFAKVISRHKPKIIYTVHGWVFNEPMSKLKRKLYIFLEKLASHSRDKIIVLGESEKQTALKYKICKPEKLEIINNAIPSLKFLSKVDAREKLSLPQDKIIIGTIAGLYKTKGLEYLIKASEQLANNLFVIIGDGPEFKNQESRIKNQEIKNIKLLGNKEDASQYLNAFNIFVLPSIKEGAPYVILEAMQAGLPIVTTKVGSVEEMLKDYPNKILVEPGNTDALKDAITKIKTTSPTTSLRTSLNFVTFLEKTKSLYN